MGVEVDVAGDPAGLDEERHGVDPEAVHTELEPEADDLGDLVTHLGVRDVEVGLVAVEVVQVPLAGAGVLRPDRVFGVGEDDPGTGVGRRLVAPHVPVPVGRALRAA